MSVGCQKVICGLRCKRAKTVFGKWLFRKAVSPTPPPTSTYRLLHKGAAILCGAVLSTLLAGFCNDQLPAIHEANVGGIFSTVRPLAPVLPHSLFPAIVVFQVPNDSKPIHSSLSIYPAHFEKTPIQPEDRQRKKFPRCLQALLHRVRSSLHKSSSFHLSISSLHQESAWIKHCSGAKRHLNHNTGS